MNTQATAQASELEATTRRAMLHMLEDLQQERDAIRAAHQEWINTVDSVRDPLMVHDEKGCVLRANQAYAERAGMTFKEILRRPYWECFPKRDGPLPGFSADELFRAYAGTAPARHLEFTLPEGRTFLSRVFIVAPDAGRQQALHLFEDVTDQRAAEHRIRSLNTLYATLSAVNHTIVHSKSRHEISERIVRISTEISMWHGAWVGFADAATGRILPEAWSESMKPYIDRMSVSIDPNIPEGQGPTGNAVRTAVPYFCNDVFADPATLPWRGFAQSLGANTVAAIPLLARGVAPGVVNLYSREKDLYTPEVRALVVEMGDDITFALEALEGERQRRAAESALLEQQAKLRRSLEATIEAIAATVEMRDPYTAGHQHRVADLACAIAQEMGIGGGALEGIHFGALIHDLGKIQIPAEILAKPRRLSALEFELIKTHPQAGYDIVKGIDFPWPVADMVHQHHERLDGSGYPQGLKGEAIALEARILAVADVVEAMASHRPYRPGLGIEAALSHITEKRGIWFDERAVDACLRVVREKRYCLHLS